MSHHRGSRSGGRAEFKDSRRSSSPPPPPPRGGRGGSGSPQYSSYYKERFGSQSPEEYKSLRITNIDPKINGEDLRELLDKVFRRYGEMHTKIVRQMDVYERIAYINFEHPDDARDAKHDCLQKIYTLLGKRAKVDPANVVRDQGGRFVQKLGPAGGPPGPPGPFRGRSRSPPPPPPFMDNRGYRRNDSYDRYPKVKLFFWSICQKFFLVNLPKLFRIRYIFQLYLKNFTYPIHYLKLALNFCVS